MDNVSNVEFNSSNVFDGYELRCPSSAMKNMPVLLNILDLKFLTMLSHFEGNWYFVAISNYISYPDPFYGNYVVAYGAQVIFVNSLVDWVEVSGWDILSTYAFLTDVELWYLDAKNCPPGILSSLCFSMLQNQLLLSKILWFIQVS